MGSPRSGGLLACGDPPPPHAKYPPQRPLMKCGGDLVGTCGGGISVLKRASQGSWSWHLGGVGAWMAMYYCVSSPMRQLLTGFTHVQHRHRVECRQQTTKRRVLCASASTRAGGKMPDIAYVAGCLVSSQFFVAKSLGPFLQTAWPQTATWAVPAHALAVVGTSAASCPSALSDVAQVTARALHLSCC